MMNKIVEIGEYRGFKYYIKLLGYDEETVKRLFDFNPILNPKWYCGYVEIPKENPFYKKFYDDIPLEVHGGLTFSDYLDETGSWCIGFDCNHWRDDYRDQNEKYTEDECKKLIDQMIEMG